MFVSALAYNISDQIVTDHQDDAQDRDSGQKIDKHHQDTGASFPIEQTPEWCQEKGSPMKTPQSA